MDWFKAGAVDLKPAIRAERATLLAHKKNLFAKTLTALCAARNSEQRITKGAAPTTGKSCVKTFKTQLN